MRWTILLIIVLLSVSSIFSANFVIHSISQGNENFVTFQPLGISASNNYLYVTTANGVLTLTTNLSVVNFTQLPGSAIPLAINNTVYVTDYIYDSLFAIKNGKIVDNITLGGSIQGVGQLIPGELYGYGLAYDPNDNTIYVANGLLAYVTAIHLTNYSIERIYGFSEPTDAIYNPSDGLVYITDLNTFDISAIQGTSVIKQIALNLPTAMGVISNNTLYVTSIYFGYLVIINLSTGSHTCFYVGNGPYSVAYDPQNGNIYVTLFNSNSIAVVHGTRIIGKYNVGSQPTGILYYNGLLYVALYGENKIEALDPNTMSVVYSLSLGNIYTDIIYYFNNLYITEYYNNQVIEMSPNGTIIRNITLNSNPYSITGGNGDIFVTCPNSNRILELSRNLDIVNVIKVPDPTWIAYYNGELYVTSYSKNLLYIINIYNGGNYSLPTGNGPSYVTVYNNIVYVVDQLSNQITIYNGNQESEISLTFTPLGIIVTNNNIYVIGNNQIDIFNKNFQDVNNIYINLVSYPFSFPQFYQGIVYNNSVYLPYNNYIGVFQGSEEITSYKLSNLITALAQAGSNIYAVSPFSKVYVFSKPPAYTVKIVESGLPNGTLWSININGTIRNSTQSSILLNLTEGIYNFTIMNISHYYSNFTYKIVNVTDNETIYVKFYPFYYSLTFYAINMNGSISWQIRINGSLYEANTSYFVIRLPYGVYYYEIIPPIGYNSTNLVGKVYLDQNKVINITFTKIVIKNNSSTTTTASSSTTTSTTYSSTTSSSTFSTNSSTTSKLTTRPPPPILISSSQASNNFSKYLGVILIIMIGSILGIIIIMRK